MRFRGPVPDRVRRGTQRRLGLLVCPGSTRAALDLIYFRWGSCVLPQVAYIYIRVLYDSGRKEENCYDPIRSRDSVCRRRTGRVGLCGAHVKAPVLLSWNLQCICATFTAHAMYDFTEKAETLGEAYELAQVSAALSAVRIVYVTSIYVSAPLN